MNEYQSMEIHSGASRTYSFQDQITKNGKIFPLYHSYNKHYPLRDPNQNEYNYTAGGSAIDVGHIAMIDSEDISEFKEVYDKLYGKEIELDSSYFDMISNPKKLQAKCTFSAHATNLGYRPFGQNPNEDLYNATMTGSITSTSDSTHVLIIPQARCPWMGAVSRDRTSKVSQLNVTPYAYQGNSGVYGATKNFRGDFYEGELTYDEGDLFAGEWKFQFGNPRSLLLPEMHIYFRLFEYKYTLPNGTIGNWDPSMTSVTDSFSSQKVGNVSLNASVSTTADFSAGLRFYFSVFIGYIVVTPTKIYAWVAFGGGTETRLFSRVPLNQISQEVGVNGYPVSDFVQKNQSSINFLGHDLPVYILGRADSVYDPISQLSLTGTSYTIQKVEDY